MSTEINDKIESKPPEGRHQAAIYQIKIQGHLNSQWAEWFGDVVITLEENGDTLLTGLVVDQSALHGMLKRVRDLGMVLLAVNRVEDDPGKL